MHRISPSNRKFCQLYVWKVDTHRKLAIDLLDDGLPGNNLFSIKG